MKKLVSILMILAMIVPLAGAQSTDIFKKKKKKKSKTEADRKSTRLNSSHKTESRMPSSA